MTAQALQKADEGRSIQPYEAAIQNSRERFDKIADQALVSYDREALFAMQMLIKNDYSMSIANKNPKSVILAMANVASTGLTLNPAYGLAYLVPRDGAIHLDISYKGLLQIATDTGSIMWGRAEVVHEADEFDYLGPANAPIHKAKVFSKDRGPVIGAYCIAKTCEGDILAEVMTLEQLHEVRNASTSWTKGAAGRKGPWENYFTEMCRKAVIKRAQKTWPRSDKSKRLQDAVEIANQAEGGYTFDHEQAPRVMLQDDRKQRCDEAAEQYAETLEVIKDAVNREDWYTMTENWLTIPQVAQTDLWLAPTKGGFFSTHERKCIKEKLVREPVTWPEQ